MWLTGGGGCSRSVQGSGYHAAVLAETSREVIAIDRLPELAGMARTRASFHRYALILSKAVDKLISNAFIHNRPLCIDTLRVFTTLNRYES